MCACVTECMVLMYWVTMTSCNLKFTHAERALGFLLFVIELICDCSILKSAFSNVTEGFVNVIATIDVSVNICRKELRATRRATGVWRSIVHVDPAVLASVVVALQKCHQLARSSWL